MYDVSPPLTQLLKEYGMSGSLTLEQQEYMVASWLSKTGIKDSPEIRRAFFAGYETHCNYVMRNLKGEDLELNSKWLQELGEQL